MDRRDFFCVIAGAVVVPPMFPAQTHGYVSSGFVRAFGQGATAIGWTHLGPPDNKVAVLSDGLTLSVVRAHP